MHYIKKNEKAIRSSVALSFCGSAKMVNVVRNKAIIRMESALAFWIQDLRKKNIPLDIKMIRKKALNLYSKFSGGNEGEPQPGPSSFIIGEYNTIKKFLIYHYYVHIILHYYCFKFIITTLLLYY